MKLVLFIIDLGVDAGIVFGGWFIPFSGRARNVLNLQKPLWCNGFIFFTNQRNTFLIMFIVFFVTSFGIGVGCVFASMMASFWNPSGVISMCFGDRFADGF